MTSRAPSPELADHSGEDLNRTRKPIHEPGFVAYCPVCGIGCETVGEAETCCVKLGEPSRRRTKPRWERRPR